MTVLKVTMVGDQPAVLLTPELASRLQATDGGELHAVASRCGIELVSSSEVARQLDVARQVMREDRDTLSRLAE